MAATILTGTPITPERAAEIYGVPKKRAARLIRWAQEAVAKDKRPTVDQSTKKTKPHGTLHTRSLASR